MRRKRLKDNGIYYIIIGILCLSIFFLSFKVINKLYDRKKDNVEYDEAITAFLNIDGNKKAMKSEEAVKGYEGESFDDDGEIENFYLKVLLNSNSHMQLAYGLKNPNTKDFSMVKPVVTGLAKKIEPFSYLKSQFPAIVNIIGTPEADNNSLETFNSDGKSKKDTANTTETIDEENLINDLFADDDEEADELGEEISVEDPAEAGEGIYIYEQSLQQAGINVNVSEYTGAIQAREIASLLKVQPIEVKEDKPYILVYHTHGTESYYPKTVSNFHTSERGYNVTTLGEMITKGLEEKGHNTQHIDTYNDLPSYNKSYSRSLAAATKALDEEKNLKVIFDVHRDAVDIKRANLETAKDRFKINIDGKDVATFSMVIGPENPNKEELIKFAQYVWAISDSKYPGLCSGIIEKKYGKFNEYLSDHYALIEIGSNVNTIEEAKGTAELITNILSDAISGLKR